MLLGFQGQTTLNSKHHSLSTTHTLANQILGISYNSSFYPCSHLAFTWLTMPFCSSPHWSVSQGFCFCFLVLFWVDPRIMPFLWEMTHLNLLARLASFLFKLIGSSRKAQYVLSSSIFARFLLPSVVLVLVSLTNKNSQWAFYFCPKNTVFPHSLSILHQY